MRSTLLTTWALGVALGSVAAHGQEQTGPVTPKRWLEATKVADGVWRIDDHGGDNMYLVEGASRALLVDTGLGVARLADFVKTLTARPVIVVNTHGHPDHAGGNDQFRTVHAPALDFDAIRAVGTKESRQCGCSCPPAVLSRSTSRA